MNDMTIEQRDREAWTERERVRLQIVLEQYRQVAQEHRHFCSLVWQHTVASILTIVAGGAAVLINNVSNELRGSVMTGVAILLGVFLVALSKHDYADKRAIEWLDSVDSSWIKDDLAPIKFQRRTHIRTEAERAATAYVPPDGLNNLRAIPILKFVVCLFIVVFVLLGACYWGDVLGAWNLPSALASQRGTGT